MIQFVLTLLLGIIILYLLLIISYIRGWFLNFNPTFVEEKKERSDEIKASIIVSCRNEERNIANLITDILNQDVNFKFELLIINDHSEDKTLQIALAYAEKYQHIKVFSLNEIEGKKNAIQLGIQKSKSELILVTDADCRIGTKWLSVFYNMYQTHDVTLISAIVMLEGTNFFTHLQSLEFLSLIASGAGSIGIGKGIMCNGANLAFSKKIFEKENILNPNVASGDDVFLLQSVKKHFQNKVLFATAKELIVKTKAKPTFRELMNQRIRWASKSSSYSDWDMQYASLIVFLANLSLFLFVILFFLFRISFIYFLGAFLLKASIDFLFLYFITRYLEIKKLLKYFIPLVVLYPIYILVVAFSSQFLSFTWKGRKYKQL